MREARPPQDNCTRVEEKLGSVVLQVLALGPEKAQNFKVRFRSHSTPVVTSLGGPISKGLFLSCQHRWEEAPSLPAYPVSRLGWGYGLPVEVPWTSMVEN